MKRLFLLFLLSAGTAVASYSQTNPCDDPVYLRLLEIDLDEMSEREFGVFQEKSTACTQFLLRHGSQEAETQGKPPQPDSLKRYSTKGFSLRVHLVGQSWYLDSDSYFDDTNFGGGGGLGLSFGVSELVTLYFNGDGSSFDEDYWIGYGDFGVRFTFASDKRQVRPFAEVALTGFGAERRVNSFPYLYREPDFPVVDDLDSPIVSQGVQYGDVTSVGGGLTLGGGMLYFFNPSLALDVGLDMTFGEISEIEYLGFEVDEGIASFSTRLFGGIAWYPGR